MLNTPCRNTGQQPAGDSDGGNKGAAMALQAAPAVAALQDPDKSMRLQACWIRLWDRWACEQRNLVLYQMHINHALSRERSKLTLAGGRVVTCSRRVKQQQQQQHLHHHGHGGGCRSSQHHSRASNPSPSSSSAVSAVSAAAAPAQLLQAVGAADTAGARDLRVLSTAVARLRASGWYYEGPDAQARAANALAAMPAGRFCVRDSRHSEHLFTMDVQTGRCGGQQLMSVRFTYADGAFGLDSAPRLADALRVPTFRCPIELIDYYVRLSRIGAARQMLVHPVWVDQCGQFFSWMNLRRPMVKADPAAFPSLKHMARLVINRHKRLITITPTSLPNELIEYLLQYPYSL